MKTNIFHSFDPVSTIGILSAFNLACGTNRVHKVAAMWLLIFSVKNLAAAALTFSIVLSSKSHNAARKSRTILQGGAPIRYSEVTSSLVEAYTTDDVIT